MGMIRVTSEMIPIILKIPPMSRKTVLISLILCCSSSGDEWSFVVFGVKRVTPYYDCCFFW